jgi:hypothetical protein
MDAKLRQRIIDDAAVIVHRNVNHLAKPKRPNKYGALTPTQDEVLSFIKGEIMENQMPPTRREIAEAFGWKSGNAADCVLRALRRKGAIELRPGISRGIKVLV